MGNEKKMCLRNQITNLFPRKTNQRDVKVQNYFYLIKWSSDVVES